MIIIKAKAEAIILAIIIDTTTITTQKTRATITKITITETSKTIMTTITIIQSIGYSIKI